MKISRIAGYIPDGRLDNYARQNDFGITAEFIDTKLGVNAVARKSDEQETSDLCVSAYNALTEEAGQQYDDVDCLIVCTQNPDAQGIPHTSAIVHGKLGLPESCASFDISLGCSGYVYGLSIISSFMSANGLHRGLLFTADPYSKIVNMDDKNTCLLFGDGATVTLIETSTSDTGVWRPDHFQFFTRGRDGAALCIENEQLHMNGRAVFSFSATETPPLITRSLEAAGLTQQEVDLFLLHQGSKYIVDTIRARLDIPADKVPFGMTTYGNTVSSSIPMLLKAQLDNPELSKLLLCGFGVGLSAASCILTRQL